MSGDINNNNNLILKTYLSEYTEDVIVKKTHQNKIYANQRC